MSLTITSWPQTYDEYSALHTQQFVYLNRESWAWNVNPSTLKIPPLKYMDLSVEC